MNLALWKREFRGGQRRWWRQPWMIPALATLTAVPLYFENGRFSGALGAYGDFSRLQSVNVPAPFYRAGWLQWLLILLWTVLTVHMTHLRNRPFTAELHCAGISARSLALLNTFGSVWPGFVAMLILWMILPVISGLLRGQGAAWSWLWFYLYPSGGDEERTNWLNRLLLLLSGLGWSLIPMICLATVTSWCTVVFRRSLLGLVAGVAFGIVAAWLFLLVESQVREWAFLSLMMDRLDPPRLQMLEPNPLWHLRHIGGYPLVWLGANLMRVALPTVWLVYWWRWTSRGFARTSPPTDSKTRPARAASPAFTAFRLPVQTPLPNITLSRVARMGSGVAPDLHERERRPGTT